MKALSLTAFALIAAACLIATGPGAHSFAADLTGKVDKKILKPDSGATAEKPMTVQELTPDKEAELVKFYEPLFSGQHKIELTFEALEANKINMLTTNGKHPYVITVPKTISGTITSVTYSWEKGHGLKFEMFDGKGKSIASDFDFDYGSNKTKLGDFGSGKQPGAKTTSLIGPEKPSKPAS